ncbi:MAG: beta-ketoacyl-ACP synthase III [Candidatus Alcyoniella australis]|nr:beta-ketoacyl-ACP synthase III [Candidatus Alcyoniella australis]
MYKARIIGTGFYVPPKVVTNADLAKLIDTTDEWIQARTGVKQRHYVEPGMCSAEMSEYAARAACQDAGIDVSDIDFIYHATLSPDHLMPGTGVMLGHRLGLGGVPAMDVRNQCTGFVYSLASAQAMIETGMYKTILVNGCEIHSTGLEFADRGRDVTVIFGDGAGSAILTRETRGEGYGILKTVLHADGKFYKALWCEAESSCEHPRLTHEMLDDGRIFVKMKGKLVFAHACQRQPEVMREALEGSGYSLEDVDAFVFHQANLRIIQYICGQLEVPESKVHNNIDKYGNTTAATIPIVMHEARQKGLIKEGSLVLISSFGAGFTWAASLVRF